MRTSNPVFSDAMLESTPDVAGLGSSAMTVRGAAAKSMILTGLALGMALLTFGLAGRGDMQTAVGCLIGGGLGGLVLGLVTCFIPSWSPFTAPLYAIAEGLFLGAVSGIVELRFGGGIALQALAATFGTLCGMLFLYQSGLVRATEKFKMGVGAATLGVFAIALASMISSLFFGMPLPYLHGNGLIGIGFSVVVVVIAALNLVLDFDSIESMAAAGAPKYYEWYGAYGLLVTLVWLYLEILRLLMKLRSSDD